MKEIYTKQKDGKISGVSVFWNYSWKEWTCTFTEREFKNFLRKHGIKFTSKDFTKRKK